MFMKQGNKTKNPMLTVRITEEHKAHLKRAAKSQGLTLSAWTITTLNEAAKRALGDPLVIDRCLDNFNTDVKLQERKVS